MGISSKKGKAPIALPTVNALNGSELNGLSKASRQAKKLASRKARINKQAGIFLAPDIDGVKRLANSDSVPALTTKGAIRATGGSKTIKMNKSTASYITGDHKLVSNVDGHKVELGNRATYPAGERVRIEADEKAAHKAAVEHAQSGKANYHTSRYDNAHNDVKRPVTLSAQLFIKGGK